MKRGLTSTTAIIVLWALAILASVAFFKVFYVRVPAEVDTEYIESILLEHNFNSDVKWCYDFEGAVVCRVFTSAGTDENLQVTVDTQIAYIQKTENNRTYLAVFKLTPPYVALDLHDQPLLEHRELSEEELNKLRSVLAITIPDILCVQGTDICYVALTPTFMSEDLVVYYSTLVTLEENGVVLHV